MDLPSDEAADVLRIPLGTYKSRLHRATEAMRAALQADDRPIHNQVRSAEVGR